MRKLSNPIVRLEEQTHPGLSAVRRDSPFRRRHRFGFAKAVSRIVELDETSL
jgi:hypothetical protein